MEKRWVIGDVHGCLRTLRRLVEERIQLTTADTLYLLGDYVSRGPDSKGTLDYVMALPARGYQVVALQGNHEEMTLNGRADEDDARLVAGNGGRETLRSFGVSHLADIPAPYFAWMESLSSYAALPDYVLVHAGLNFDIPDPFADQEAMRWARHYRVPAGALRGRPLVHGHTPTTLADIRQQLDQPLLREINLDNGCVYPHRRDLGNLLALELGTRALLVQPNCEGSGF